MDSQDGRTDSRESENGPVTEVVYLPINKNRHDLTDLNQRTQQILETIKSQPGSLATHSGYITENQRILEIHTKWLSLRYHQDFIASEIYKSFYKEVGEILDGDVMMFHFRVVDSWALNSQFDSVIGFGSEEDRGGLSLSGEELKTMEVAIFYCKENSGVLARAEEWIVRLKKENVEGCLGACVGKVLERISPLDLEDKKEDSSLKEQREGEGYDEVVVLMVSWANLKSHMVFREGEVYKRMVGILDGFEQFEMVSFSLSPFLSADSWMFRLLLWDRKLLISWFVSITQAFNKGMGSKKWLGKQGQ